MQRERLSFDEQLARGREVERAVARWFMRRGARILPVYDYSGLADAKAPKLEAFAASDSLVTPDLLVARSGRLQWVEVKLKERADFTHITQVEETGIGARLWDQYQQVQRHSGALVWLSFVHIRENAITLNSIDELVAFGPRCYHGSKMDRGGMRFWPLEKLRRVARYSDLAAYRAT